MPEQLRTLSHDLHSSISQIQWVVTGYLLSLAAVIPVTGWAARRFGAKRVYLTSLVLFSVIGLIRPENTPDRDALLDSINEDGREPVLTGSLAPDPTA